MKNKTAVVAQSFSGVVSLGKSKRLSEMRAKLQRDDKKEEVTYKQRVAKTELSELDTARNYLEQAITEVKSSYPEGKRNSLFALRYASEREIERMTIEEVFKLLKLDCKNFKDVLNMPYKK